MELNDCAVVDANKLLLLVISSTELAQFSTSTSETVESSALGVSVFAVFTSSAFSGVGVFSADCGVPTLEDFSSELAFGADDLPSSDCISVFVGGEEDEAVVDGGGGEDDEEDLAPPELELVGLFSAFSTEVCWVIGLLPALVALADGAVEP